MKKEFCINYKRLCVSVFVCMMFSIAAMAIYSQSTQEGGSGPEVKEFVDVINVELIMRALQNNRPVSGLLESDFIFTENGKPVEITSFTEVHRKIGARDVINLENKAPVEQKKRFFLFYLWITDRNINYQKSLDYFFNEVYRDGDQVIMMVRNKAVQISNSKDILPAREKIDSYINQVSRQMHITYRNNIRTMMQLMDECLELASHKSLSNAEANMLHNLEDMMIDTLKNFIKQYRVQFLNINMKQMMAIAQSLKNLQMEKWGIVLFQNSTVPIFDIQKMTAKFSMYDNLSVNYILRKLREIEMHLKLPIASMKDLIKLQQAFISADATFHLMIPEGSWKDMMDTELIKFSNSYSEWQEAFSKITKATGGDIITSNMMKTALQKVVNREDIFYRITYKPRDLKKKKMGLKIRSKFKGIDIYHVSKVDVKPPENIELFDFQFNDGTLSMTIKNYHRVYIGDQELGDVQLQINIIDESGKVVESMKRLKLKGEDAQISLKTNISQKGRNTLMVTVYDNYSGLKAQQTLNIINK